MQRSQVPGGSSPGSAARHSGRADGCRYSQLGDGALGDHGVVGEVGDHLSCPPRRPSCPAASGNTAPPLPPPPPLCPAARRAPTNPHPLRRSGPGGGAGPGGTGQDPPPGPHVAVRGQCRDRARGLRAGSRERESARLGRSGARHTLPVVVSFPRTHPCPSRFFATPSLGQKNRGTPQAGG